MKEKRKFYQQSWFIMLLLFSPLFPVGLFLMWKEKGMNFIFKIIFTLVYLFAIVYTIQSQDILFTKTNEGEQVQEEQKNGETKMQYNQKQKDLNTIIAFVAEHEEQLGEFYESTAIDTFNNEKYDSAYDVKSSVGEFLFHIDNQKVVSVRDKQNQELEGLSY